MKASELQPGNAFKYANKRKYIICAKNIPFRPCDCNGNMLGFTLIIEPTCRQHVLKLDEEVFLSTDLPNRAVFIHRNLIHKS